MHVIIKLNPRPGNTYNDGTKSIHHVVPDFLVYNTNGALELLLNSKNAPELRLSRSYLEMLDTYSKEKKDMQKGSEQSYKSIQSLAPKIGL